VRPDSPAQEALTSATIARQEPHLRAATGRLRRLAAVLAALTCTLAASAAIMPAAWAVNVIPNDGPAQAPASAIVTESGMPGWQITQIAVGATLIAAIMAVCLDRARTARRAASATTT
jgi:hypothetical protein